MNKSVLVLLAIAALGAAFFATGGTSWFETTPPQDTEDEHDPTTMKGDAEADGDAQPASGPVLFASGKKRYGHGALAGQIKWFANKQPASDVQVTVTGTGRRREPVDVTVRTDARGVFSLTKVSASDDLTLQIAGEDGQGRTVRAVVVEPEAVKDLGVIWLGQVGVLEGRVMDLDGKPIPGAKVQVHTGFGSMVEAINSLQEIFRKLDQPPVPEHEVTADGQGRFELPDVLPGTYSLVASAKGFEQSVKNVTMTRDGPSEPVVLKLAPGVLLRGVVVDTAGKGVGGARVVLLQQNGFVAGFLARTFSTTDSAGRFEVMAPPGGDSLGVMVAAKDRPTSIFEIKSARNEHRFEVAGGATIHMRVIQADSNKPLKNAEILLFLGPDAAFSGDPKNLVTAVTDEQGEFECFARPGGIQMLWVKHPLVGQQIYAKEMGLGAKGIQLDDAVLRKGMNRRTVKVAAGTKIFGVVKSSDGTPIPGARVRAMGGIGFATDVLTDAEGRYECLTQPQIVSGLVATAPGWVQDMEQERAEPAKDGGPIQYDIVMLRAVAVQGRVTDEAGAGIGGVRVSIVPKESGFSPMNMLGSQSTALTDRDGRYVLDSAAGGKDVRVVARRSGFVKARSEAFKTGTAGTTTAPTLKLGTGYKVKVTVLDPQGEPVPYASLEVDITPKDGVIHDPMSSMMEDDTRRATAAGVVRLEAIPVGTLQLTASGEAYAITRIERKIEATDKPIAIELTLRRAVPILGRVVNQDSEPVKGAQVSCGDYGFTDAETWVDRTSVHTDADGRFTLEGVPEISLKLEVSAPGHQDGEVEVIGANRDRVEVTLQKRGQGVQEAIDKLEAQLQEIYGRYMEAGETEQQAMMKEIGELRQKIAELKGEASSAAEVVESDD